MAEREIIYSQSDKNDFKRYFRKYWRYWYVFGASLTLCLGLAFAYLKYATPRYLVSSVLLIRDVDKGPNYQSGNAAFQDLDVFNRSTTLENEIESLKSVTLMQRVLTELSLQASYYVDGFLKKQEVYGSQVPLRLRVKQLQALPGKKDLTLYPVDNKRFSLEEANAPRTTYAFGQLVVRPYGTFTVELNPAATQPFAQPVHVVLQNIQDLTTGYNKDLTVAQNNKKANVLTVSLTHPVPEKGIDILNTLIEVYNKESKEDRNLLATNTISFIDERLRTLISELSETEKEVEQFKRQNQVTDVRSEASAYLEESTGYNKQLSELNIQLDVVKSLQRYLSQQKSQFELVPSTLRLNDPALQELVGKFNELQLQRKRMLRVAEPANPLILNINEQLANLRLNMLENLRSIGGGLQVTRGILAAKANDFQSRTTRIPNIERELNAINRQAGVKRDLYIYLLQKREESALSLAATVSNTRVIDPALASKTPVDPNKPVAYGLALVLGLVLPFGFLFLRDFLSDTVQQPKDVTQALSAPILGEIGHAPAKGLLALASVQRPAVAEQFRFLRSNLPFVLGTQPLQVILVTSSTAKDGKTFVCLNLAVSLSQAGKRVVVVDFNMRHPGVLAGAGLPESEGVTDYLASEGRTVCDLLQKPEFAPNLLLIGTGKLPPDPAELMLHPRVASLIGELRKQFDYVLLDSAPVGQVADVFALAPYLDATLLVVRCNQTPRARLDLLHDVANQQKLGPAVVVLNDARRENSSFLS
ncbi:GNVR domain-containing protein [Hymenobacter sp. BT770]|uniref:GumC family protein n=1 Tax=Hymenobacter sp. BT770 TaxID=2886942 RepID=UPI001D12D52B|nr:tyrosine-protein kinase [Hymenobacter sp. BT770]MCC3152808.1 capsular biosynthesis protein [Hymenobacter sp. BT770]MDO3414883.1 GNVR domain-containing protein [Hymenobacter sp. BT770]